MRCRMKDCHTIISEVANRGTYCFIHQKYIADREIKQFFEGSSRKWSRTRGQRISAWVSAQKELTHMFDNLKDIPIKIRKKKNGHGKLVYAIYRYAKEE